MLKNKVEAWKHNLPSRMLLAWVSTQDNVTKTAEDEANADAGENIKKMQEKWWVGC